MVEITPEQAVVSLALASRLYLTEEERNKRDLSSLIRHPLYGDILVGLAHFALQEDVDHPLSSHISRTAHMRQRLVLQTRYDLDEGKLRSIEETAKKLSLTRKRTRQIEAAAVKRIQCLETPAWKAFKIFFLKTK